MKCNDENILGKIGQTTWIFFKNIIKWILKFSEIPSMERLAKKISLTVRKFETAIDKHGVAGRA